MEKMPDRFPFGVSSQLEEALTNCAQIMMLNDDAALARALDALSAAINADVQALDDAQLKKARASEIFERMSKKLNLLMSKSGFAAGSA